MSSTPLAPTRSRGLPNPQKTNALWTDDEDERLKQLMNEQGVPERWIDICHLFPGKNSIQIGNRWTRVLDPQLVKGSWTREEDEMILNFVKENGPSDWSKLAARLPGRIGKQCRERWTNHLNPNVDKREWSPTEDEMIIHLRAQYGNSWSKIAKHFDRRSDNALKNRWNSTLKRRLERIQKGEPTMKKRGRKTKPETMQEDVSFSLPASNFDIPLAKQLLDNPGESGLKFRTQFIYPHQIPFDKTDYLRIIGLK
jgi:hypothetical protein